MEFGVFVQGHVPRRRVAADPDFEHRALTGDMEIVKAAEELKADRDRWTQTAWNAGQTAKQLADTNRDAVTATAALAETVVAGGQIRPVRQIDPP